MFKNHLFLFPVYSWQMYWIQSTFLLWVVFYLDFSIIKQKDDSSISKFFASSSLNKYLFSSSKVFLIIYAQDTKTIPRNFAKTNGLYYKFLFYQRSLGHWGAFGKNKQNDNWRHLKNYSQTWGNFIKIFLTEWNFAYTTKKYVYMTWIKKYKSSSHTSYS